MDKIQPRMFTVGEYGQYTNMATGTVYNMVSEYFRTGSTGGLFVRPIKVGPKKRAVRFDRVKLDKALDELED